VTAAAEYREWRPAADLSRHVACTWAGRMGPGGETYVRRVLPDGCVDIVWDGTRLVVAGPDTGPVDVVPRPDGFFVGVRFRPGLAPTVLGLPASELLDARVDASAVLGDDRARLLSDRLAETLPAGLRAVAGELEDVVAGWVPQSSRPDPLVEATVAALGDRATDRADLRRVASLADNLGVSERQLHRRCRAAVGYGPKTLDRVLRFRRFLAMAEARPHLGLARLAVEAGYADQPHLNRECGRLADTTPAALLRV
jgi:AraC-like DNA-binding protein